MNDIVNEIDRFNDCLRKNGLTEVDLRIFESNIIRSLEMKIRPVLEMAHKVIEIEKKIDALIVDFTGLTTDPKIEYLKACFETRFNCMAENIRSMQQEKTYCD